MKSKYGLPFSDKTKAEITKPTGEYAHENFPEMANAVDFLIPKGTQILAVKGGKVIQTKSDSNKYGLDKKFAEDVNYVAIDHGDGTYSEYLHLGKDKVVVKEGQKVKAGELLGYSGLSGCMSEPHLHLNIFRIENGKGISIPYEVQESKDEKRKSKGGKNLEKLLGIMFIIGVGISLLSFSGITGNVIGTSRNNLYGSILVIVSLICGGIWVFLRNK